MAQLLATFLNNILPAPLLMKFQSFFFNGEIHGDPNNTGQNGPIINRNTESSSSGVSTVSSSDHQAEPQPIIPDIEAGLPYSDQHAYYYNDHGGTNIISPSSSTVSSSSPNFSVSSAPPPKGLLPSSTRNSSKPTTAASTSSSTATATPVPQQGALNSIAQLFRENELGRTIIGFPMPVTTVFVSPYAPTSPLVRNLIFLSLGIGFVTLWNGILLRHILPRYANLIEQTGAAFVILAFYGLISVFLPNYFIWIPWTCFIMVFFPHFWSYYLDRRMRR